MPQNFRMHLARLDRFCARLNYGLAAVALVLGLLTVVTATIRVPQVADLASQQGSLTLAGQAAYD